MIGELVCHRGGLQEASTRVPPRLTAGELGQPSRPGVLGFAGHVLLPLLSVSLKNENVVLRPRPGQVWVWPLGCSCCPWCRTRPGGGGSGFREGLARKWPPRISDPTCGHPVRFGVRWWATWRMLLREVTSGITVLGTTISLSACMPSALHASPTTAGGSGQDPCGLALFNDPRCPRLRTECSR